MLAVRAECDVDGCGRHFYVPEHELRPTVHRATLDGAAVLLGLSLVHLPGEWVAEVPADGIVRLYCADHGEHLKL